MSPHQRERLASLDQIALRVENSLVANEQDKITGENPLVHLHRGRSFPDAKIDRLEPVEEQAAPIQDAVGPERSVVFQPIAEFFLELDGVCWD